MAKSARDAALLALSACRKEGAWSDGALKQALFGMERREAALASRLCYGVLQNRLLLDWWIDGFTNGRLHPAVRDVLRLGVYQLCFMDRIPASAAICEAVEQTKRVANPQAARLVNGVLRSVQRALPLKLPNDPAIRYSHPQELVELLTAQYGAEKTARLLLSHNEAPETVIQCNTLKTDTPTLCAALDAAGVRYTLHPWLPDCLTISASGSLEQLTAFREGLFYVQDTAARLAALSAGLVPGQCVLDCCAAPGGKSFAAAVAMKNRGELISCDIHPHKLSLIEAGAQRLGVRIIRTQLQDASRSVDQWRGRMDVVMADVPCSGLGVIRKKPDIRYKELRQTAALPELQLAILECQSAYVKRGGVLLYSTCTILRRENEEVAQEFLRRHPEFRPETVDFPPGSGIPNGAMTTLLPCDHGTDGFFICKFRRDA